MTGKEIAYKVGTIPTFRRSEDLEDFVNVLI
jgi:hypothetical protein